MVKEGGGVERSETTSQELLRNMDHIKLDEVAGRADVPDGQSRGKEFGG